MKRLNLLFSMFMVIAMTLSFSACSDDNDSTLPRIQTRNRSSPITILIFL